MIARETIQGILLEATETLNGKSYQYNFNGKLLVDPKFMIDFVNEYTGFKFENDTLKQKQEWIKTNNYENPDHGKRVLIQTTSKMVMIADLTINGWRTHETGWKEYKQGESRQQEYMRFEDATHWMPLPEAIY